MAKGRYNSRTSPSEIKEHMKILGKALGALRHPSYAALPGRNEAIEGLQRLVRELASYNDLVKRGVVRYEE